MLKWLQQRARFSFLHIFSILFESYDCLESGTREWILILRMRYPILPNTKRPFWSMRGMNTVPNIDVWETMSKKAYRAAISSPLQRTQYPVNHPSIPMIWPWMMKNTQRLTMWLRRHPDQAITQHVYWPQPGSRWYCHLKYQRTWGNLIQI